MDYSDVVLDSVRNAKALQSAYFRPAIKSPVALQAKHLSDARLYACREDMLKALLPDNVDAIAEIGVALGDFSSFLIQSFRPKKFTAVDVFDMHAYEAHWGRTSQELFGGDTHLGFYEKRFADSPVETRRGLSSEVMPGLDDQCYDLIYIDADHLYEGVKSDAMMAVDKIKPNGLLVFNDYTMFDPFNSELYGVVQAVNELVTSGEFVVVGFALQPHMFCDIALKRPC